MIKTLIAILGIFVCANAYSLEITGFGTGQFSQTFSDFSTNSQTATTFQIIGTDNNSLFGSISPTITAAAFANPITLQLTGIYTGTALTNFQIGLFDNSSNERLYQGNFAQFTPQGSPQTVTLTLLAGQPTLSGNIVSIELLTGGTGLGTVNLTLDSLTTPVPEPSSMGLVALGAISLIGVRQLDRRKSSLA